MRTPPYLVCRYPFNLVPPLPGQLVGSLPALHAGVHGQQAVVAEHPTGKLFELAQTVVVEGAAGESEPVRLLVQRRQDVGVTVALHSS